MGAGENTEQLVSDLGFQPARQDVGFVQKERLQVFDVQHEPAGERVE